MSNKLDSVRKSLFGDDYANGNVNVSTEKFYNYTKKPTPTPTTKSHNAFIVCAVVVVIIIVTMTGKSAPIIFNEASVEMLSKVNLTSNWLQNNYMNLLEPLLFGLVVTIFTTFIMYLDSDVPGVSPPTPFSPRKAQRIRYSLHKEKTCRLSFLISIASGIVTFFLMFL